MRLLRRVVLAILLAVSGFGPALSAQSLRTLSGNRSLSSRKDLHVNVKFAAGSLAIGRDETGMLYRAKVTYDEDRFEPVMEYRDATLTVGETALDGPGSAENAAGVLQFLGDLLAAQGALQPAARH